MSPQPAPEAVVAHHIEWLVLPEAGRPGDQEVGCRRGRTDLDQLGPRANLAKREHRRRSPAHHDQEVRYLGAERDARQDGNCKRDHHRKAWCEGDRHDHPDDGHGHDLGVPGLRAEQADQCDSHNHQAAEHGDAAIILGESRLTADDQERREEIEPGDQGQDAEAAFCPIAQRELSHRGLVLVAKQDELLRADPAAGFDQHVAAAVNVVTVRDAGACLVAKLRRRVGFVCQSRKRLQLAGDHVEQDLADLWGREDCFEFLGDRPIRLDDPFRDHTVARHRPACGPWLVGIPYGEHARPFLIRGKRAGAEDAIAKQRLERNSQLGVQVIAPLRGVRSRFEVEVALGLELPARAKVLTHILEAA